MVDPHALLAHPLQANLRAGVGLPRPNNPPAVQQQQPVALNFVRQAINRLHGGLQPPMLGVQAPAQAPQLHIGIALPAAQQPKHQAPHGRLLPPFAQQQPDPIRQGAEIVAARGAGMPQANMANAIQMPFHQPFPPVHLGRPHRVPPPVQLAQHQNLNQIQNHVQNRNQNQNQNQNVDRRRVRHR